LFCSLGARRCGQLLRDFCTKRDADLGRQPNCAELSTGIVRRWSLPGEVFYPRARSGSAVWPTAAGANRELAVDCDAVELSKSG